jgi:hypothetical protein
LHAVRRHEEALDMATMAAFTHLLVLSLVAIAPRLGHAQGVTDQVRTWFLAEYAPLWRNLDQLSPERISHFWAADFRDHPIDTESSIWANTTERWQRNIERYRAEGLRGSAVVAVHVEEISARAVLIRTVWSDYGQDGPSAEPSCGTFIAGKFGRGWKFTNYFTVDCSAG